jgi:hypothetical protein
MAPDSQIPSLPSCEGSNPTVRANSQMDKTWGQRHLLRPESAAFPGGLPFALCSVPLKLSKERLPAKNQLRARCGNEELKLTLAKRMRTCWTA